MKRISVFIGKKLCKLLLLMLVVEVITFALMEASPIDPVTAYVGASTAIGAEQRELIAEKWGLNQPPASRFMSWLSNILKGDWGDSMIYRRPVMDVIRQKFLSSLALMAAASAFAFSRTASASALPSAWSLSMIFSIPFIRMYHPFEGSHAYMVRAS